jgi:hypothetical protein
MPERILGKDFIVMLRDAGVITRMCRRVIIDIVRVYHENNGDAERFREINLEMLRGYGSVSVEQAAAVVRQTENFYSRNQT